MRLKLWFAELRAPFLLLTPDIVAFGTALAWMEGYFSVQLFALTLLGATLLHVATNVLNDYFDYVRGIDLYTRRTPFSGGSGLLPAGLLEPRSVYALGVASMIAGMAIGAYLALVVGPWALVIGAIGALTLYTYTPLLTRYLVGEFATGLNFGPLMVLGAYYVQTGRLGLHAFLAGVPIGLGTANLLLLNEFPDVEADARGGRRTLPIVLGKLASAKILAACYVLAFTSMIALTLSGVLPEGALLGLLAALPASKAVKGAMKYPDDIERLIPHMAANIQAALMIPFLMTLGIVIQGILF